MTGLLAACLAGVGLSPRWVWHKSYYGSSKNVTFPLTSQRGASYPQDMNTVSLAGVRAEVHVVNKILD